MITTNRTQPAPAAGPTRDRVVTTNHLKLRTVSIVPREHPGLIRRETRKVSGQLTTDNLEERVRTAKRAECARVLKAAKAELVSKAMALDADFARDVGETTKKAGRPRKVK